MYGERLAIERVIREEYGQVLSAVMAGVRDLQLAEDAVMDAVTAALETWPRQGVPERPGAWILQVARRKALDRVRRQQTRVRKKDLLEAEASLSASVDAPDAREPEVVADEQLRMMFLVCHPAISRESQVCLVLRTLGGLSTAAIARAFLKPVPTVAARLTRAKVKMTEARIPFVLPPRDELPARLDAVLAAIYLVFNEGYAASSGERLLREDLCVEALRLARLLVQLLPDDPEARGRWRVAEALGLLALMTLHHARRAGREHEGRLIPLEDQDRSVWDADALDEGIRLTRLALSMREPGPYQIQAAIAALHAEAPTAAHTDWSQIAALYGALRQFADSPVVRLNEAAAHGMAYGPDVGLAMLDRITNLEGYYLLPAARADLLRRARRYDEAREAYVEALALVENEREAAYLRERLDALPANT
ncbi:MAG: sigma-70 family RNA polymerase sigma factor [Deltaproteobacteria bacterium]|nr:MAG: sigma-70 family RNA polymerase sigma factor [Deltaproteobacteria bacterium]